MTNDKVFWARIYKTLYTIRLFETRCDQLYRQGLIRGYFHPYLCEEAIAVGVCAALKETDYIASTHRGHGHCIAKGADIKPMVAELLGKRTGYCLGLGGSMHIADLKKGNLGANAIVGANLPLSIGAALGFSIKQDGRIMVAFTSDGGANNGVFSESLNLGAVWNLPLIFVIENNQYAVSTPIEQSTRETSLIKRGIALGVESVAVDGNDVLEVYETTKDAVQKCRKGKGPILIEAITYRHGGHHVNDPGTYIPSDKLQHYKNNDPVLRGRKYLMERGNALEDEVKLIEQEVEREMEEAIAFAKASDELTIEEFVKMVEEY